MRAAAAHVARWATMRLFSTVPLSSPATFGARGIVKVALKHQTGTWHAHSVPRHRLLVLARAASSSSSKSKQIFKCNECGEQAAQWTGQCKSCGAWNTLERVTLQAESVGGGGGSRAAARFAAIKGSGTGSGSDEVFEPGGRSMKSVGAVRRTAWVQDAEAPQRMSDVSKRGYTKRWRLLLPGDNGQELGRVLGGGVVPGSLTLVGGEPGVGKSTLLLQMASMLTQSSVEEVTPKKSSASAAQEQRVQDVQQPAHQQQQQDASDGSAGDSSAAPLDSNGSQLQGGGTTVLYVSGEESVEQIASRAERMGPAVGKNQSIFVYSATRLDAILDQIVRLQPTAVVVDSIQTIYLDDLQSSAGSVVQVRECAVALGQVAKREKIPIFLVGHVTKAGDIAGPRVLEHIVDTVVYMEGGRQQPVRLVRTIKNRFGNTDEIGVFEMHEDGMQVVPNPSAIFLSNRDLAPNVSSAVAVVMEGTRPLLMEVQALCSSVPHGAGQPPGRYPSGVNRQRLALILAVLGKHTEMRPYSVDVHLNVTGGLEMNEPSTDLAVACAIASSYYEQPIARDVCLIGEVGLGGELRPVMNIERRITEAAKLGFATFVIPASSNVHRSSRMQGARLVECRTVQEAFRAVLGDAVQTECSAGTR